LRRGAVARGAHLQGSLHVLVVEVVNRQTQVPVDAEQLAAAVRRVLAAEGYDTGQVSIAVVDDAEMHALNCRHLDHDYPTDVLSFSLERQGGRIEGDIVASAQYAAAQAPRYGWAVRDELLLYVVHGALHLAGHDDAEPAARSAMQALEDRYLGELELSVRRDDEATGDVPPRRRQSPTAPVGEAAP
jgi:probable rRNA maturation factor